MTTTPPLPPTAPELRLALGRFATGVTLITCRDAAGLPVGLTVNSFNALSLEPALVLWSLRLASSSIEAFRGCSHFCVNVLAESHLTLSRRFAKSVPDKFAEGLWHDGLGGAPVLDDALAAFECRRHAEQPFGDHLLFVGAVERLRERLGPPLVYQGGHYREIGDLL